MIKQKAREWLGRARHMEQEIEQLQLQCEAAFSRATSSTVDPGGDRVQSTPGNTTEQKFVSYADYSVYLNKRIDELFCVKSEIMHVIAEVKDTQLRMLLISRYINSHTWDQIAEEMNYSEKWVRTRLHENALFEVDRILKKNERVPCSSASSVI